MTFTRDTQLWVRLGVAAFVTVAFAVAVIDARRAPPKAAAVATAIGPTDPVATELARCAAITDPAAVDPTCRQAWAEHRARFFGAAKQEQRP
ncbi:putative entry exclusion protein TrbK-alt [Phenylobacterium sp.]|uniref:putative entry exclusion protein TrbK-alt n=1 Tax=Phenylobacterium sp. TaxID=1871053 RepID=UPI0037C8EAC1